MSAFRYGEDLEAKDQTYLIEGAILDIDYLIRSDESVLRLTIKGRDGKAYEVFDHSFKPYFYLVPTKGLEKEFIEAVSTTDNSKIIKSTKVVEVEKSIFGKNVLAYQIFVTNTSHVPKLSSAMSQYGTCYEYDIPFAKRYSVDKEIVPLEYYKIRVAEKNGSLSLEAFEGQVDESVVNVSVLHFDIEVYNPLGVPRATKDPYYHD